MDAAAEATEPPGPSTEPPARFSPRLERIQTAAQATTTATKRFLQSLLRPSFLEQPLETAGPLGQWLAAFFLIVLVPLTFTFIRIIHTLLVIFLNVGPFQVSQSAPFGVTLLTLLVLIAGSWLWFMWVRTAGFGMTNIDPREAP